MTAALIPAHNREKAKASFFKKKQKLLLVMKTKQKPT
jgi:hypothetical protein